MPLTSQGQAAGTLSLTPASNQQSGQLPSGVPSLSFLVRNYDWLKDISLPTRPSDGQMVEIRSTAGFFSSLDLAGTELGPGKLKIEAGDVRRFVYDAAAQRWNVVEVDVAEIPVNMLGQMPTARIRKVQLRDGEWAPKIELPAGARDGDLFVVHSSATWPSLIRGEVLFDSTLRVEAGDRYVFIFSAEQGKWIPQYVPERKLPLQAQLPVPTGARARLSLLDGQWLREVTLPTSAGDRDRIIVESIATWDSRIVVPGGQAMGPLVLKAGDRYEFMYVADDARWVIMDHPERAYQARDIVDGRLPALTAPRARILFGDGNWQRQLTLPEPVAGAEVVVDTSATYPVEVVLGPEAQEKLETGERVTFTAGTDGKWHRMTRTIDLLVVYSDNLAGQIGEPAVRARAFESLNITNDTLENSGGNFRFRLVGFNNLATPVTWTYLNDALATLPKDTRVQKWRDDARADVVYYMGTEGGCGLAYTRAINEVGYAAESFGCGANIMRHELGHVIALHHTNPEGYWQGYALAKTVMNGNGIALYSTPLRFTSDLGLRAGLADKYDAVRALNERSANVAAFR